MNYRFEVFYQSHSGVPHEKIEANNLSEYIGRVLADRIMHKASYRMSSRAIPEVDLFFKNGGRQVIVADLTNRGNVFIEAVEVV